MKYKKDNIKSKSKKFNGRGIDQSKSSNNNVLVDFHVHSIGSSDGYHDIPTLLHRAKKFNVDTISITDHNNFNETIKLLNQSSRDLSLAIHDMEGVNFVPGVEVTCRVDDVKNFKGNTLKVHLLILAPQLTDNSYLVKLMKIKHGNDLAVDFGLLFNIAKMKGIHIEQDSVRDYIIRKRESSDSGFSSFGKDDVMDYFRKQKVSIAKSNSKYEQLFDSIPRAERLNLSALDVINIAHASGGICVMAHPKVNLQRTNNKKDAVESLLEYGIDGFELMSSTMDNDTFGLITNSCQRFNSKNKILYTGGSDFHIYSESSKIGRFAGMPITYKSQEPVLKELKILNKARAHKSLTHRNYKFSLKSELDDTISKYSQKAHEINEIYSEAQKRIGVEESEDSFRHSDMTYIDYLKQCGVYDEGMEK